MNAERFIRPRVKPEHAPFRISAHRIRIGGLSYGVASEVEDPNGSVWTLLDSMDGTRTVDDVMQRVLSSHPYESPDSVKQAIASFASEGYLEEADAQDPPGLTARDKERYDRGHKLFRWMDLEERRSTWDVQAALLRARVTVVGLGGTGGVAALALTASGVGALTCVDHDVVELSNLNRQIIYSEDDIGAYKVDAAVRRLRRLNADIQISGVQQKIEAIDDIRSFAVRSDVLLLAADQPSEIRTWANRACIEANRPWVAAGYHGPVAMAGVYMAGRGGCYECLQQANDERRDALGVNVADGGARGPGAMDAASAVSAGISGYLAAHAVIALIIDVPKLPTGQICGVNLVRPGAPFILEGHRRSDCPACGEAT